MNTCIYSDSVALGKAAGKSAAQLMIDSIVSKGSANIILATGTSQFETIKELVANKDIDWSKVIMFHLDEYISLPITHPASFRKYLRDRFLSQVPPLKNAWLINGETGAEEECKRLGDLIQKNPIDVALIGIGENGHLAFNDPPADFETEEPYIIVQLDDACKKQQMDEGWFQSVDEVPESAVSMSIKQILKSKHIICSVPGERKAIAVKNTLEKEVSNIYPSTILQTHHHCTLFVDRDSASLLDSPTKRKNQMNQQQLIIYNGKIVTPNGIMENGSILVCGKKIIAVNEKNIESENAVTIDAKGKYVAPGFIDIHVHGGGGHDFMDGNETAFLKIAELHARYGTTSMLPTTLTSSKEELLQTLANYETANKKNTNGAQFLGMHLEGPYLSTNQCGAQDVRYIRNPDAAEYQEIISSTFCIKRWSSAPELKGSIELGRFLRSKNILPAIAHTDAVYEEVLQAFNNGYTLITHLYSAMTGVTRRNAYRFAGVIESAYLIDEMDVEIIADGIHLPAPLLKLVYKIKGPDRIALITDAMRAAGMPEGESILGSLHNGVKVIVEDGVAKLPDRSSFAGSVATANRLLRTMVEMAEIPIPDAVKMLSATPARIMNVSEEKGELVAGKDADIVIFDDDFQIQKTIVQGKVVYEPDK